MSEKSPFPIYILVVIAITITRWMISTTVKTKLPLTSLLPPKLQNLDIAEKLHDNPATMTLASRDYGNMVHELPAAVLSPTSPYDILSLIHLSHNLSTPFTVAARGHGHSIHGQAMAANGVVVDMESLRTQRHGYGVVVSGDCSSGFYADVGGEQLWIDVLESTLRNGLAPVSWTDYLYLTIGGTLSNAGISGTTFRYGPQISNVIEMDVITGKGDLVTCSTRENSELFLAVLGGLGQFGIITRARITLEPAPKRVKWVRLLYNDFSSFTRDQEHLISNNGRKQKNAMDYLEGLILVHQGSPDSWRSSFFPLSDHSRIISLVTKYGIIYCLEVAKFYNDHTQNIVDKEIEYLLKGLSYMPGFFFDKSVSYVEFLNRVRSGELMLQSQGLWDVPHPWLNLFVPKSGISDFNSGVFMDIVLKRNITTGPILVYPMNRNKWDNRMSAVIPAEDIFYSIGFLHSSGIDGWQPFEAQNNEILKFCNKAGIEIKQYLPHYDTQEDWVKHFGKKWIAFENRKSQFDPRMILSPGQGIFNKNELDRSSTSYKFI